MTLIKLKISFLSVMGFLMMIIQPVDAQLCTFLLRAALRNYTCSCDLGIGLFTGFSLGLDCIAKKPKCSDDANTYCGTPQITTNVYRRRQSSQTSITFDANPIFGVGTGGATVDPGPIVVSINHTVPIRILRPIEFASCKATVDNQTCRSCVICDNKKQVKFDCANVQLDALYYIPASQRCLGLDD